MAMTSGHHTPEGDYRSHHNGMSAPNQDAASAAATQLDFYQAMADFKHMFPNMDEEVIEAVLRSNSGAVDATIDQLLTMNSDCGTSSSGPKKDRQKSSEKDAQELPSRHDVDAMAPPPYSTKSPEPPPSYLQYAQSLEHSTQPSQNSTTATRHMDQDFLLDVPVPSAERSAKNSSIMSASDLFGAIGGSHLSETTPKLPLPKGDLVREDSPLMEAPPAPLPQLPDRMPLFNHDYTPRHQLTPKRLYKNWNPPLLGRLPDDFLRIMIGPGECHHCHHHSFPQVQASPPSLPSPQASTMPTHRASKVRSAPSRSSSQASSPRLGSTEGRSPRLSPRDGTRSEELSSEMIQQKIVENERKRTTVGGDGDPAQLQMLEDERMALMIQNEEFLNELMGDEDFMSALERDHMNATAFEPSQSNEPELDPDRPKPEFMEGYGDDRDVTLGAFPFDRSVPKDRKAEFRRKLNNMGTTTKKKLVTAARGFFSRKKRPSKQLLKDNTGPSTVNRLEEEDVYAVSPPGGGEPHPRSHVSYGKSLEACLSGGMDVCVACCVDGVHTMGQDRDTEIV